MLAVNLSSLFRVCFQAKTSCKRRATSVKNLLLGPGAVDRSAQRVTWTGESPERDVLSTEESLTRLWHSDGAASLQTNLDPAVCRSKIPHIYYSLCNDSHVSEDVCERSKEIFGFVEKCFNRYWLVISAVLGVSLFIWNCSVCFLCSSLPLKVNVTIWTMQ